ncbi:MAG: MmcQ/YjbR family DNA-binding protein [Chloroflexota bacterium]
MTDPTDSMRLKASLYPDVDAGTACTQSSFKANKKGFLYVGEQGGRFKAMFKLKESILEAEELAHKTPDDFQVGNGGWVTARFSAEDPLPEAIWHKWLDESYALTAPNKKR